MKLRMFFLVGLSLMVSVFYGCNEVILRGIADNALGALQLPGQIPNTVPAPVEQEIDCNQVYTTVAPFDPGFAYVRWSYWLEPGGYYSIRFYDHYGNHHIRHWYHNGVRMNHHGGRSWYHNHHHNLGHHGGGHHGGHYGGHHGGGHHGGPGVHKPPNHGGGPGHGGHTPGKAPSSAGKAPSKSKPSTKPAPPAK